MKKYLSASFVLLASLALVACSQTNSQSENKNSSQGQETSQTSSKDQKKSDKVDFNGSYYSVKGKYGDIMIVNKRHPIDAEYNPGENATAKKALLKLQEAMKKAGFAISDDYSGFRSYDTQVELYNNYVASDGQEAADRYSARPGYSEHQTGLAFDIKDASGQLLTDPEASKWLAENAHKYGFIIRFPEGGEESTGYMPEAWHIRYIGKEATDIYKSGKTLEQYYGVQGGDYAE